MAEPPSGVIEKKDKIGAMKGGFGLDPVRAGRGRKKKVQKPQSLGAFRKKKKRVWWKRKIGHRRRE